MAITIKSVVTLAFLLGGLILMLTGLVIMGLETKKPLKDRSRKSIFTGLILCIAGMTSFALGSIVVVTKRAMNYV